MHGPTGHYFYGMLDAKLPGTKPMTVASKVAIDQVRFAIRSHRVGTKGSGQVKGR